MKKLCQIALLVVILCALASCASSKKPSQVKCPAYGGKSSGFERMPY